MIGIAYDFGKPKDGTLVIKFYIVICEKIDISLSI